MRLVQHTRNCATKHTRMNKPLPSEAFVLDDDEKKLSYKDNEMMANAGTFTILKEVASVLSSYLVLQS